MNDKADFTQGSILKKLIAFMIPVLGSLILQAAYGAVDLLVVGRFGSTSGLSAVSTGSQVLNLVTFVVTQFAMGITVLIARYLGEKRPEQIGSVIGGSAVVFTMIAVGLFIVMVGFAHPISVLMQAPKEAVELTSVYVRICGGGIFFIVAYNLLSAIFRGLGDSKSPLLFVFVACIVTRLQYLHRLRNQHPVPQRPNSLRYLRIPIVITWRDRCSSSSSSIFRRSLVAYEYFQRSSLHYSSSLNSNLFLSLFLNYTRDLKLFLLIYCSKISLKKIIKKIYKK